MEMITKDKKTLAATSEVISLYVDLRERKVTEFENRKIKLIDDFINLNKEHFNPGELRLISKIKK